MGEIEAQFLIAIQAISTMVNFYLGHKATDFVSTSQNKRKSFCLDHYHDIVPFSGGSLK